MLFIIVLISTFVIYKTNKALLRLEFKQEALCYDIYVLNNQTKKEEQAFLREAGVKV